MRALLLVILATFHIGCEEHLELVFEEQFDGESLNTEHWNYELGDGCPNLCGWGNNERQIYTKENARLINGNLVITGAKNDSIYSSSRMTTKGKMEIQYGVIEVRAMLPQGHGLWPAIWMLGNDIDTNTWPGCGEIDIMEYVGKEPHTIYTSLHTPSSFGTTINTQKTINTNIEEGFHTYKIDWNQDRIKFFIDDKKVYTYAPDVKDEKTWPFDKPFYLLINMAIGGDFGGPEVDDSIFPQEFLIDYVKIYKRTS